MSGSQEAVKRPAKKLSVVTGWPGLTVTVPNCPPRARPILPSYPIAGKNSPLARAAKARASSTRATATRRS
jgi:hypothetical protein